MNSSRGDAIAGLSKHLLPPEFLESETIQDRSRAARNLENIASLRLPVSLFQKLVKQIVSELDGLSDPDMAINNLERFFKASRSPLCLAALFERDPTAMPVLLKVFSTSQYLTDQIVRDPSSYDALRLAAGQPVSREVLIDEIDSVLSVIEPDDLKTAMAIIRRFKHRETLRIAYGDIVGNQTLETVTNQISYLADAICTATLNFSQRSLSQKHGQPLDRDKQPSTLAVIAMGKLGGQELNYSSDIDLVFFYSGDGESEGRRCLTNREFFDRVGRLFVKLLTENTPQGAAYRVDMRLRPGGQKSPLSCSIAHALSYYDIQGRTWERQALVKARVIAGDHLLGDSLLRQLAPWVYAPRLSIADINGIKALKRQIERRATRDGDEATNIKTGHGGIRDIEFAIQFLQLLHGYESPSVRTGNTLAAIGKLYQADCLNSQEQTLLDQGYRWLRHLEHRLQIMFDLQTHSLPESPEELTKLAYRMGIEADSPDETLQQFEQQLSKTTEYNRKILDHLLHNAFAEEATEEAAREGDLVLDAFMSEATIKSILQPYGFEHPLNAHRNLMLLATERNRFLSPRRCRHFFAAIVKQVLTEISETPRPDETLLNLTKVSDSLGGKSALWELFSSHPSFLKLYVRLCASCEYLCNILTRNPGMIDEITDALVIQELPAQATLRQMLADLVMNAEDIDPIIHSFKAAQHLRVGVRDINRQDDIARTHECLSDIAEVCLSEIIKREHDKLVQRFGQPLNSAGQPVSLCMLAMGKLGGREPNYHSDLDIVFLHESDIPEFSGASSSCSGHEFFSRLSANVTKTISGAGPYGRLYEIDCRLRPTGKSGSLVISFQEFCRYFEAGDGQLWERLALCKARPITSDPRVAIELERMVFRSITSQPWQAEFCDEVGQMRLRMQEGASPRNIKRGQGGTVDVEFAIQMLQLKYAAEYPDILFPNTVLAANALARHRLLSQDDHDFFCKSYQMLRWVEARLRLMNTSARHDLPEHARDFANLALLLRYDDQQQLRNEIEYLRRENRRRFTRLLEVHARQIS